MGAFVFFNLVKWTLFGKLSEKEVNHLKDKISYTIWEFWFGFLIFFYNQKQNSNLSSPVIKDEFFKYSGLFLCILLLKSFHLICAERSYSVLMNLNSPHCTTVDRDQSRRLGCGALVLNMIDLMLMGCFFHQMYNTYYGYSVLRFKDNILVAIFGFEIFHSYPLVFLTGFKYLINHHKPNDLMWQAKREKLSNLMEFGVNLVRFIMSCIFAIVFLYFYTFPFHIIPSSYLSLRLLIVKARCLISLERRNLKLKRLNLAKDIDPDSKCIICFDQLNDSSVDGVKCLNDCDHSFHYSCLKNWLNYSHNCPVCRTKI